MCWFYSKGRVPTQMSGYKIWTFQNLQCQNIPGSFWSSDSCVESKTRQHNAHVTAFHISSMITHNFIPAMLSSDCCMILIYNKCIATNTLAKLIFQDQDFFRTIAKFSTSAVLKFYFSFSRLCRTHGNPTKGFFQTQ